MFSVTSRKIASSLIVGSLWRHTFYAVNDKIAMINFQLLLHKYTAYIPLNCCGFYYLSSSLRKRSSSEQFGEGGGGGGSYLKNTKEILSWLLWFLLHSTMLLQEEEEEERKERRKILGEVKVPRLHCPCSFPSSRAFVARCVHVDVLVKRQIHHRPDSISSRISEMSFPARNSDASFIYRRL